MTTTQIHSGVTVGDANQLAGDADKQEITGDYFVIHAQLTNGNAPGDRTEPVRLYFYSSPVNHASAADAIVAGGNAIKTLDIRPNINPNGINEKQTQRYPAAGGYLYSWLEFASMEKNATFNAWVNQIA